MTTYSTHAAQDKSDLPIILPASITHWTISDLDLVLEASETLSAPTQTEAGDPMRRSAVGRVRLAAVPSGEGVEWTQR